MLIIIGDEFQVDLTGAGAIKFAEKNALPGSQDGTAVFNRQKLIAAYQGTFDMGR